MNNFKKASWNFETPLDQTDHPQLNCSSATNKGQLLPRLPTLHQDNNKKQDKITPKFSEEDKIRVQDVKSGLWNVKGVILGPTDSKRSFILETDEGATIRRNEKFIKLL